MSEDEDDKATVVLDLNALKAEQEKLKKEKEDLSQDIQFSTGDISMPGIAVPKEIPIVLFDFKSTLFTENQNLFPSDNLVIATELSDLNTHLKNKDEKVIFFNYIADPKSVNKLLAQIKSKFPFVKTVVIAKNLAPDKAKIHQNSRSGANGYLNFPFTSEEISQIINNL